MTPPQEPGQGSNAAPPGMPSAVSVCPVDLDAPIRPETPTKLETLKNRPDFLKAAQALRHGAGSFLLQARARGDGQAVVRVGFTASKKIGNAVARNRAKRRLREVARNVLSRLALPGWDYVLVARPLLTNTRVFAEMLTDMEAALARVHKDRVK